MPSLVSTGMGDRIGVQLPLQEIYLSVTNRPGQLSLAIPSWVGAMSTGQRVVMLCDWGVKADMVLFAGNTVWSISDRVSGVCVDTLYKSTFTLLYFTLLWWHVDWTVHSLSHRTEVHGMALFWVHTCSQLTLSSFIYLFIRLFIYLSNTKYKIYRNRYAERTINKQ